MLRKCARGPQGWSGPPAPTAHRADQHPDSWGANLVVLPAAARCAVMDYTVVAVKKTECLPTPCTSPCQPTLAAARQPPLSQQQLSLQRCNAYISEFRKPNSTRDRANTGVVQSGKVAAELRGKAAVGCKGAGYLVGKAGRDEQAAGHTPCITSWPPPGRARVGRRACRPRRSTASPRR